MYVCHSKAQQALYFNLMDHDYNSISVKTNDFLNLSLGDTQGMMIRLDPLLNYKIYSDLLTLKKSENSGCKCIYNERITLTIWSIIFLVIFKFNFISTF